jgi:small-conductance mechanosensitive channel
MTTEELQEELQEANQKIVELEARTKTTLTGTQFLTIVLIGPLFLAFVTLGVLIVWKTTSKPAEIAPHLDIILVAFSIFALPVTGAAAAIVSIMSDEIKGRIKADE